jgi:hypothetical protein
MTHPRLCLTVFLVLSPMMMDARQRTDSPPGVTFPREGIIEARSDRVVTHGPVTLTADALARLPQSKRARPVTEDVGEEGATPGCPLCGLAAGPGEPANPEQTPAPTGDPWLAAASLGGLDPQIAAGTVYLVITTGGQIAFYDKAGKLLTGANGKAVSPVTVKSFFAPLIPDMNTLLNLPSGADLTTFGLKSFYDARVIYDNFRHRFWIAALASNKSQDLTTIARAARRTKVMAAVSIDEDPRHGWLLYWWNAVIDDGVCNDPAVTQCIGTDNQPGDAGDYPCLGISDRFFMVSNHVGRYDPQKPADPNTERYAVVHVLPADSLAGLAPPAPNWAYWNIHFPDQNSVVQFSLQPAVHHNPDPLGFSFLADNTLSNGSTNTMVVLGFSYLEAPVAPPLRAVGVSVKAFGPARDAPQSNANQLGAATLKLSNVVYFPLKAVFRDNKLYVTWQDCRDWTQIGACQTSNRLLRVDTSNFVFNNVSTDPATGFIDRPFGWRNVLEDPQDELAFYGMPVVEVNKNGDMVVVYNRSSADLDPEVRYSVYFANGVDVLPSRLLKDGEGPLASGNQTDTGGISVDPFDDTAVWMAHSYAFLASPGSTFGKQRVVVGKVFGLKRADLFVGGLVVKPRTIGPGDQLRADVRVANQGDGVATDARLVVALKDVATGASFPLGAVLLPDIQPGSEQTFSVSGLPPAATVARTFEVEALVDADHRVEEYSETNNLGVATDKVRVRPPRQR